MTLLKLALFLTHIILESTFFSKNTTTFFSFNSIVLYALVTVAFLMKLLFHKYNRLFIIFFSIFDVYFGFTLFNYYYDENFLIQNQTYYLIVYAVLILCVLFDNNNSAIDEIKKSSWFSDIFFFICNIILSYYLFYHFKLIHIKTAGEMKIDSTKMMNFESDYLKITFLPILKNLGVDYLLFFNLFGVFMVIKYFYSKSKKRVFLVNIFKRMVLFLLVTILFFLNYIRFGTLISF